MRIMKNYCIIFFYIFFGHFSLLAQRAEYVLFDKDILSEKYQGITINRMYADLEPIEDKFPDITIYNYYFRFVKNSGNYDLYTKRYLEIKNSLGILNEYPYDILITITPLSKDKIGRKNITEAVSTGEITFLPIDSVLTRAKQDIFHAQYAPLGIFERKVEVNLKRTDYELVVKEGGQYFHLESEALTEAYYIDLTVIIEPALMDACRISRSIRFENKESYLKGTWGPIGAHHKRYQGKILLDTIVANPFYPKYHIRRYWTNIIYLPSATQSKIAGMDNKWYAIDGIGDFEFMDGLGIINGNFLDYFYNSKKNYYPDKELNKTYNLYFRTRKINGLKPKDYISNIYLKRFSSL